MKVKNVLLILVVGFLLFWLFQDPAGMADSSQSLFSALWELLAGLFESVLDFVKAL